LLAPSMQFTQEGSDMTKREERRFVELGNVRFRFLRHYQRGESLRPQELVIVNPRSGLMCVAAERLV
jgi:hypothetical protein